MSKSLEERYDELVLTVRGLTAEVAQLAAELRAAQKPIAVGDRVVCVSTVGELTQDWEARPGDVFTVEHVDTADMTFKEGSKWYNLLDFQRVRS